MDNGFDFFSLSPNDPTIAQRLDAAWHANKLYPFVCRAQFPSMSVLRLWLSWADHLNFKAADLPEAPWVPVGMVGPLLVLGHWDDTKGLNDDALIPSDFSGRCLVTRGFYDACLRALRDNFGRSHRANMVHPANEVNFQEKPSLQTREEARDWLVSRVFMSDADQALIRTAMASPNVAWPAGWDEAADFLVQGGPLVDLADAMFTVDLLNVVNSFLVNQHKAVCFYRTDTSYYIGLPDQADLTFEDQLISRLDPEQIREVRLVRAVGSVALNAAQNAKTPAVLPELLQPTSVGDVQVEVTLRSVDLKDIHPKQQDMTPELFFHWSLYQAYVNKASDIHLENAFGMGRVRIRVGQDMHVVAQCSTDLMRAVVAVARNSCGMSSDTFAPQDGRFTFRLDHTLYDVRASSVPVQGAPHPKLCFRLLGKELRPLSSLGLPQDQLTLFQKMIRRPKGLVLVTGPTGSGKTTTLYGALSEINTADINIHTVENPVEIVLDGLNQHQVDTKRSITFAALLREILRQDPDVILIGEIRDLETAEIAIQAAMTGHLVFATLHTNSASDAPTRLVDMGIEPYMLADTLIGLQGQRLVRQLCSRCKKDVHVTDEHRQYFRDNRMEHALDGVSTLYAPAGCPHCRNEGYVDRTVLMELYPVYGEFKKLIAKKASGMELEEAYSQAGYRTLFQDGLRKVALGLTTPQQASEHNSNWVEDSVLTL